MPTLESFRESPDHHAEGKTYIAITIWLKKKFVQVNPREQTLSLKPDARLKGSKSKFAGSDRVKYRLKTENFSLHERMVQEAMCAASSATDCMLSRPVHVDPRKSDQTIFGIDSKFTDLASRIMELS